MIYPMRPTTPPSFVLATLLGGAVSGFLTSAANAQTTQTFPPPAPPAPSATQPAPPYAAQPAPPFQQPPPAQQPAAPPGAYPQPAPAQQPAAPPGAYPQPAPAQQPAPAAQYPQPAPAQPAPAQATANGYPPYAQNGPVQTAPPPPAAQPASGSSGIKIPPLSFRADIFDVILNGRLALEIEVAPLDWLSIETVPVFVLSEQPLGHRIAFRETYEQIYQSSAGLGPLAGASLDIGLWLDGKAFDGSVVRAGITYYGFTYTSKTLDGDTLDQVVDPQTRLMLMLADHRKWGHFTLATGIGLEYDLQDKRRCYGKGDNFAVSDGCKVQELQLALTPPSQGGVDSQSVQGFLHPLHFAARFSLGVVFD